MLENGGGKQAVGDLKAQWAGLKTLKAQFDRYLADDFHEPDISRKNRAQHALREAFDPFFKSLHEGLVFIELKNSNIKLKSAFDDNLTNYKKDIPQLFLTNAFCVLSNAFETRVGSFTAGWEYFFNWLRKEDEKRPAAPISHLRHVDTQNAYTFQRFVFVLLQRNVPPSVFGHYFPYDVFSQDFPVTFQ